MAAAKRASGVIPAIILSARRIAGPYFPFIHGEKPAHFPFSLALGAGSDPP